MLILPRRFKETEIDLKNECGLEFGTKVSGKYLAEVCRNGHVIRQPFGPKMRENLITNLGLDYFISGGGSSAFRMAFYYARCGTGTTTPAVTDTTLTAQTQSTANLFTGGGNTYSQDTVAGTWTGTYVYEFPATGSGVTLNEIGLGNINSPTGATLSTHALFPTGVTLNAGDNLRLTYSTVISIPSLITAIPVSLAAVNGFNISGSIKVCSTFANLFGIVTAADSNTTANAPSGNFQGTLSFGITSANCQLCSAPTTFPAVNTALSGVTGLGISVTGSLGTYTAGSFTRTQSAIWVPSNPSTTVSNVNSIFLASQNNAAALLLILSAPQTKANTNTLTINYSITMARG